MLASQIKERAVNAAKEHLLQAVDQLVGKSEWVEVNEPILNNSS